MNANKKHVTAEVIVTLLKKYALLIFAVEILTRFGTPFIIRIYFESFVFPNPSNADINDLRAAISAGIILFCNIAIGLIMLQDLDRSIGLSWILFCLALISPWTSLIFVLIWKIAEMQSGSGKVIS
jgi:hypothetical protein